MSILAFKPLTRKVHTKNLGYVCPDGTINFQNVRSAHKYAKSVVVKALNQEKPFERVVMIEGSRIMKQIDGSSNEVRVHLDPYTFLCDTIVHGHPDLLGKGVTSSFSENDVRALFSNPYDMIRTIKVYNSVGEVSTMRKLGVSIGKAMGFSGESINVVLGKNEKALKIINEVSKDFYDIGARILEKIAKDNAFVEKFVVGLSQDHIVEDMSTKIGIYANHLEMKKLAQKLKVIYKTTFSNLNKKNIAPFKEFMS